MVKTLPETKERRNPTKQMNDKQKQMMRDLIRQYFDDPMTPITIDRAIRFIDENWDTLKAIREPELFYGTKKENRREKANKQGERRSVGLLPPHTPVLTVIKRPFDINHLQELMGEYMNGKCFHIDVFRLLSDFTVWLKERQDDNCP